MALTTDLVANIAIGASLLVIMLCIFLFLIPSVRGNIDVTALGIAGAVFLLINQGAWWAKIVDVPTAPLAANPSDPVVLV